MGSPGPAKMAGEASSEGEHLFGVSFAAHELVYIKVTIAC